MRLLLDTHIVVWWLADDPQLPANHRLAIEGPGNEVVVSVGTIWEVAIKSALGRIDVPDSFPEVVADEGFALLPITAAHAWAQRSLPRHHRDPFDRLLVAQAMAEGLTLVTVDQVFAAYPVARLPA
ncbi:MAG TPA: type II toxin-antitoxin system VapC family toxin [Actinomycetota bacterium]|nr:type II toxin-antitoxin system VapC family toxin [Actinomycetota bacterium]